MDDFKPFIAKVATGATLSREEARDAFDTILSGEVTNAQSAAFLMALRVRGETIDEIAGAVGAMRGKMLPVKAPPEAIDIVGTGGDSSGSYNVSTLASIITAACGVPVAKHGNRAASSRSGAADVLTALGVKVGLDPAATEHCIREAGVGFMFAPTHHASMRHVAPVRTELGTRTIFNLLGPLSNPAGVKRQVTGVFSKVWVEPLAHVLKNLGCEACWICHGEGGMDEIVPSGSTTIAQLKDGTVTTFEVTPEAAGLKRSRFDDLKGGDAVHNAEALRAVLKGTPSAFADAAVLTTAAALIVAGKAADLKSGVSAAQESIRSGSAARALSRLVEVSNA